MSYSLFRLLHLAALLVFAGALLIENMATGKQVSQRDAVHLARVDAVAGIAIAVAIVCGLILWLGVGKPAGFYSANPVFHGKLGLFALLVLAALLPWRFYRRQARTSDDPAATIEVPRTLRLLLRLELVLLAAIAVAAFLMARGIGLTN